MLILLVVLVLVFGFGGNVYSGGQYRSYGFGLGGIVLIILVLLLFTHAVPMRLGW